MTSLFSWSVVVPAAMLDVAFLMGVGPKMQVSSILFARHLMLVVIWVTFCPVVEIKNE